VAAFLLAADLSDRTDKGDNKRQQPPPLAVVSRKDAQSHQGANDRPNQHCQPKFHKPQVNKPLPAFRQPGKSSRAGSKRPFHRMEKGFAANRFALTFRASAYDAGHR